MEYHIYRSCLGELYLSNEQLDFDDLYCEQCGDCDEYMCAFCEDDLKDSIKVFLELQGALSYDRSSIGGIFDIMIEDLGISIDQIERDFKNFIVEIKNGGISYGF